MNCDSNRMCWRVRRNSALGFGLIPSLCCWYPITQFKVGDVSLWSFCLEAVWIWTGRNHCRLNPIKIKWLWIFGPPRFGLIASLTLYRVGLSHSRVVLNLRVPLDSQLLLDEQVTAVDRKLFVQLYLVCLLPPKGTPDWVSFIQLFILWWPHTFTIATCCTWGYPWRYPRKFKWFRKQQFVSGCSSKY